MYELNNMDIPHDLASAPSLMLDKLSQKKKHFLSKKKLQSEKKLRFFDHQINGMEPKKAYQKKQQQTTIYKGQQIKQQNNNYQDCQTVQQMQKEKVRLNRSMKRKNQKLGTVIIDNNKPHFDAFFLKEIIKKNKIKAIVHNFINKIRRISVANKPVQFDIKQHLQNNNKEQYQAIQLAPLTENIITLVSIFHIVAVIIIVSLSFVFIECRSGTFINIFMMFSFFYFLFELFLNLSTEKYISGKKIKRIKQIWKIYPKVTFSIDVFTILVIFLNIFFDQPWVIYLSFIVIFKIPNCLEKIQKVQAYFINNLYNQQYWSLAKIVISNFAFAHVISILLAAMPLMNADSNWMTKRDILNSPWHQRYIWSYYWGNTIMLTVGFGDIVVSNSTEALCLIFIETFSCLIFAYNINCLGNLMHSLQIQDADKRKKTKIFKKLAEQNDLPQEISWKINNYIIENAKIKKKFNFQEQRQFILSLPSEMKKQYHKESNKKVFQKITFFKSFVGKTLYNLAQNIQIKISHPQEIIQSLHDNFNLIILKIGQIAFTCKKFNFEIKDISMDKLSIKSANKESLLNLDFIVRKRAPYEIKSLEYTIYYFLGYQKFMQTIKQNQFDYEYLCTLRDKIKNIPDQFQVFNCEICQGKHLKVNCPKLHFIPYHETIINRYLYQEKTFKNQRHDITRNDHVYANVFGLYKKSRKQFQKLTNIAPNKRRNRYFQSLRNIENVSQKVIHNFSSRGIESQTEIDRQIFKIGQKYKNITNQIIKEEINKLLKQQQQEDEVWNIKLDQMSDYSNYFPTFNPNNIKEKYDCSKQLRKPDLMKLHIEVILDQQLKNFQNNRPRQLSILVSNKSIKDKKITV